MGLISLLSLMHTKTHTNTGAHAHTHAHTFAHIRVLVNLVWSRIVTHIHHIILWWCKTSMVRKYFIFTGLSLQSSVGRVNRKPQHGCKKDKGWRDAEIAPQQNTNPVKKGGNGGMKTEVLMLPDWVIGRCCCPNLESKEGARSAH